MKKNLSIDIIILILIFLFNFFILNMSEYSLIIVSVFWLFLLIYLYEIHGLFRDKNYFTNNSFRIIILNLLLYFFITYILGIFTGFHKTEYSLTNIFIGLLYIVIYVSIELSRYIIYKNSSKTVRKIFTIELIIFDILIELKNISINNYKLLFIVISTIILPSIARELLYSYITDNVNYKPVILLRLILILYPFFIPILPSLGNYLISITELLLPFLIFLQINRELKYKEKYGLSKNKLINKFFLGTILLFLIILIILTSGFFKYKLIAIISGSMEPTYYRGDAVIIEKKEVEKIRVGEILAFDLGNGIVTHRVVNIIKEGEQYTITTKGDNNELEDAFKVHNEDVIGTVNYVLKYVGYPTIWINEILERS